MSTTKPAADQVEISITQVEAAASLAIPTFVAPDTRPGARRRLGALAMLALVAIAAAPWTAEHLYAPLWQALVGAGPEVPEQAWPLFCAGLVNLLTVGLVAFVFWLCSLEETTLVKEAAEGKLARYFRDRYLVALKIRVWPNCASHDPVLLTAAEWQAHQESAFASTRQNLVGHIREASVEDRKTRMGALLCGGLGFMLLLGLLDGRYLVPTWLPVLAVLLWGGDALLRLAQLYAIELQVGRQVQPDYQLGFKFASVILVAGLFLLLKLFSLPNDRVIDVDAAAAFARYQQQVAEQCSEEVLKTAVSYQRTGCQALTSPGFSTTLAEAFAGKRTLPESGIISVERDLIFFGNEMTLVRRIQVTAPSGYLEARYWVPL